MLLKQHPSSAEEKETSPESLPRRQFLGKLGVTAGIAAFAVACQKSVSPQSQAVNSSSSSNIDYGEGDIAILNYAFLLEQLEAAFYMMVVDNFYSGGPDNSREKLRLAQVRDHEIAHREFFKSALGDAAIPDVEFDFSTIDFSSRASVLASAKSFEDLGVSAYNGVASFIESSDYLLVAGKIVSVEGRHAGYIRNLIKPGSFADNTAVDQNGLDLSNKPSVVIPIVKPYIKSIDQMSFRGLPTM